MDHGDDQHVAWNELDRAWSACRGKSNRGLIAPSRKVIGPRMESRWTVLDSWEPRFSMGEREWYCVFQTSVLRKEVPMNLVRALAYVTRIRLILQGGSVDQCSVVR